MIQHQIQFGITHAYNVLFTRDIFNPENPGLKNILETGDRKIRILPVLDSNVLNSHPSLPQKIRNYAAATPEIIEEVISPLCIQGGEACKNTPDEVMRIHAAIAEHHLCRHAMVLAIGGGAVLDACGYAAATAHRGLRLLRMPTTTLSQNDAGIGVKNSLNLFGRKNFLGTFAPPFAVVNDFDFLDTLTPRDLRAGIAEAVKVALLKDAVFFDELYTGRFELNASGTPAFERMIIRCAQLHGEHIQHGGDPFENGSSRPLDFGHWSAHKIEELSGGNIRHGEAVAIGIALDSAYAFHKGLISNSDLTRIFDLFKTTGFSLFDPVLHRIDIRKALDEFQEHIGGTLTIPLINPIGTLYEEHVIDMDIMMRSSAFLAQQHEGTN